MKSVLSLAAARIVPTAIPLRNCIINRNGRCPSGSKARKSVGGKEKESERHREGTEEGRNDCARVVYVSVSTRYTDASYRACHFISIAFILSKL